MRRTTRGLASPHTSPTIANPASASPYYQIQASDSPMFLMGSTQDTINPITTQTIPMYNALLAAGVGTQLYQIDSTCHGVKCKAQDPGLEPNSANWGHAYLDAT